MKSRLSKKMVGAQHHPQVKIIKNLIFPVHRVHGPGHLGAFLEKY
ncbi:MAG TPA: hypothetical protein PKI66_06240 [Methanobacteriaceae archaeon]|nr:hypothetical protein [Methanobacteriaceae archaeon]HNS25864.1 hypothetical protein [Methanobacteriaceae archaeon]